MNWYAIRDPADPELDRLAGEFSLHPLHIEDCRHRNQTAKVEAEGEYLFIVLKPFEMDREGTVEVGDLDIFLGRDFLITVEETSCGGVGEMIDRIRRRGGQSRADQILHRIADEMVDSYTPILDRIKEEVDDSEDRVLEDPDPKLLEHLFTLKRALVELRRVMTATRDVIGHLQRTETELIQPDMVPFFRDVYDHAARNLDTVEIERDLISGTVELYLSSVANRTNQVMKVLTVLSTLALPALIVSGMYGMNLKHLPWVDSPHAWWIVISVIVSISAAMLFVLRKMRYF